MEYVRAIYRIEARTDSPGRARRIVHRELGSVVSRDKLDEIKLLISELVTNGVLHGQGHPLTIDLRLSDRVRCEVTDHGAGPAERGQFTGEGGWGLRLVERLSTRWGIARSWRGTRVWFELPPA